MMCGERFDHLGNGEVVQRPPWVKDGGSEISMAYEKLPLNVARGWVHLVYCSKGRCFICTGECKRLMRCQEEGWWKDAVEEERDEVTQ